MGLNWDLGAPSDLHKLDGTDVGSARWSPHQRDGHFGGVVDVCHAAAGDGLLPLGGVEHAAVEHPRGRVGRHEEALERHPAPVKSDCNIHHNSAYQNRRE